MENSPQDHTRFSDPRKANEGIRWTNKYASPVEPPTKMCFQCKKVTANMQANFCDGCGTPFISQVQ